MLYGICIKSQVKVLHFIFIFISSSVPRFSMKKSVNQLIKNKRPYLCAILANILRQFAIINPTLPICFVKYHDEDRKINENTNIFLLNLKDLYK